MARKKGRSFLYWGIIPLLFLLAFYFLPLSTVLKQAVQGFRASDLGGGLVKKILDLLGFTVYQALLSTILTILVGLPISYVFSHFDFKGRRFLQTMVTLPFILPTVVVAAAFNSLLGPRGWINLALMQIFDLQTAPIQLMNTLGIILLAHIFYNTSVFVRVVGAAWSQLEIEQEQTARVLGANNWQRFWHITLPLLKQAILSAVLLVFLFDFTSFGVILLLGGPNFSTLEVEIYLQTTQMLNLPLAGILSMVQILVTMLISLFALRADKGAVAFLPDIKGARLRKPENLRQKVLVGFLVGFIILFFVLPELGLFLRSFTQLEAQRAEVGNFNTGFTFDFYRELFNNSRSSLFYVPPIEALKNSLIYAVSTTLIAGIMGIIAAYSLTHLQQKKLFRVLISLPLGTSTVTLGLGFLLVFIRLDFFQQFPQILIPIAHALVALPVVVSTLYPAFVAIPQNMHAAAATLGARKVQILTKIDLPLIRNSLTVAALYAFVLSLGEFGATSFLTRPEYPTLPIAIYRYLSLPGSLNYGQAMAMACILMVVCALSMFAMEEWFPHKRKL